MSTVTKTPIKFAGDAAGNENFFPLERWEIPSDTGTRTQIVWRRPEFVLVVATTKTRDLILILERKQAVAQDLCCLPAGTMRPGESPIEAGIRELRMESGYTGSKEEAFVIGPFFNSPDKSTERHWVVILKNVVPGNGPQPEPGEAIINNYEVSIEKAFDLIEIGMHRMALYEAGFTPTSRKSA